MEGILDRIALPVQLGGGIRDIRTVDMWLKRGIRRVILGTAAVKDPGFVREAARLFPGQVAVGIDARDGLVAVEGWARTVNMTAVELGRRFGLIAEDVHDVHWIVDFPMFERTEEGWTAMHHPFTAPTGSFDDPGAMRSRGYDLVVDGSELGGGWLGWVIAVDDIARPSEPASAAARSDRMSACRLVATIVSSVCGFMTMRIVMASTSILSHVTSGNSCATSAAISSHMTIAWRCALLLVTTVSSLRGRDWASLKA